MTVGETLAEARYRAGFTVEELSERTRIRGTVIRSIEQDDYAACGGDLYVRGYVRAIAGAVGLDAQPLIQAYDQARASEPDVYEAPVMGPGTTTFDLPPVPAAPEASWFDDPQARADSDSTRFDLPQVVPAESETTRFDLPQVGGGSAPTMFDQPQADAGSATRFDLPAVQQDPAATHREQAATAFDLSAVSLPNFDLPPAAAEPVVSPTAETALDDLIPGLTSFDFSADALRSADEGYVDEPATSMPAVPAESGMPHESAAPLPVPPGPAQPASPSPSAQPWPPPPLVRTVSTGRSVSTARAVRQTGSFAALTQTGALRLARAKRWQKATGIVTVIAMAAAGAAGIYFAGGKSRSSTPSVNAPASPRAATSSAAPAKTASAKAKASATAKASAKPKATTRPTPATLPATTLSLRAAEAFGPNGLADGDNPDLARYAIASHAPEAWSTQWYATPDFGMLKHGTGLLIDLGRRETVLGVRLYLTQYRGADLQLRAGTTMPSAAQGLSVVANAVNAGGTLRLTLHHPATARYLLVWFTLLPPDGQGHYQESVYRVVVTGRL